MRCSKCGRKAVIYLRNAGIALCERHFERYVWNQFVRASKRFGMVEKGDTVVVCVSGGKDSLTLAYLFSKLRKKIPINVVAFTVNEGIKGYRDQLVEWARKWLEEWEIEHYVFSMKKELGLSTDEFAERNPSIPPCSYCGTARRYLLNKKAREFGASKVATAHTLDDLAQTILMNVMRNDISRFVRSGPVSGIQPHEKFVPRIKPLCFLTEKETTTFAIMKGFYPMDLPDCPHVKKAFRHPLKRFLNRFEYAHPGTKHAILNFQLDVSKFLEPHFRGKIKLCKICGEPSSEDVCMVCKYTGRVSFSP